MLPPVNEVRISKFGEKGKIQFERNRAGTTASLIDKIGIEVEVYANDAIDEFNVQLDRDYNSYSEFKDYVEMEYEGFRGLKKLGWVVEYDGSLNAMNGGIEIKPGGGIPINSIKKHLIALQKFLEYTEATFPPDTGLHIHVSTKVALNQINKLNLIKNIDEENIYKFYGEQREEYAGKLKSYIRSINRDLDKNQNNNDFLLASKYSSVVDYIRFSSYMGKYVGIRPETRYGTIEFRQASLTKIKLKYINRHILSWINYINKSISEAYSENTYTTKSGKQFVWNPKTSKIKRVQSPYVEKWTERGVKIADNMLDKLGNMKNEVRDIIIDLNTKQDSDDTNTDANVDNFIDKLNMLLNTFSKDKMFKREQLVSELTESIMNMILYDIVVRGMFSESKALKREIHIKIMKALIKEKNKLAIALLNKMTFANVDFYYESDSDFIIKLFKFSVNRALSKINFNEVNFSILSEYIFNQESSIESLAYVKKLIITTMVVFTLHKYKKLIMSKTFQDLEIESLDILSKRNLESIILMLPAVIDEALQKKGFVTKYSNFTKYCLNKNLKDFDSIFMALEVWERSYINETIVKNIAASYIKY